MRTQPFASQVAAICAIACSCAQPVRALNLDAVPSAVYQTDYSGGLRLGLAVTAGTNMITLIAGGSWHASCASDLTSPLEAAREISSTVYFRYNQLYVTVPHTIPAYRNMAGFASVERGVTLECTFNYEAHAREAAYVLGIPGSSLPIGGESQSIRDSIPFQMRKPGTATGDDDACRP